MLNLIRREVRSRFGRLSLAALAVALGVAFVTMSFVLTDTTRDRFQKLFAQLDAKADLIVINPAALNSAAGLTGPQVPIPSDLIDTIRQVPGVKAVDGRLLGPAQLLTPSGKPVRSQFGATMVMSWGTHAELSPLRIREGHKPLNADEIAIDARTARQYHFTLGSRIRMAVTLAQQSSEPFQHELKLVGIFGFGDADTFGASTVLALDAHTAQSFYQSENAVGAILVKVEPSADREEVRGRIQQGLTGQVALTTEDAQRETNRQISEVSTRASQLLVLFASLGVISGAVMIANTFSMIISQRTRALALMRALGASRRQITMLLVGESLALAVLGTVFGAALGVAAAGGILSIVSNNFLDLPGGALELEQRTFVIAGIVGIVGTSFGTIVPMIRAARIPPVPAMVDPAQSSGVPRVRWRWLLAAGCIGVAIAIAIVSEAIPTLFATPEQSIGIALVAALFVGLAGAVLAAPIAPAYGRALTRLPGASVLSVICVLGMALAFGATWSRLRIAVTVLLALMILAGVRALFRVSGHLAGRNAARHAIRTGRTAVSLMIGIAVLSVLAVLVASLKGTISQSIMNGLRADVIVADPNGQYIPPETLAALEAAGDAESVGIRFGWVQYRDVRLAMNGVEPAQIETIFDLKLSSGSTGDLGSRSILLSRSRAETLGVHLGDAIGLGATSFGGGDYRIAGIFDRTIVSPFGSVDIITAPQDAAQLSGGSGLSGVFVRGDGSQSATVLKEKVIRTLDAAGATQPSVYTRAEYAEHSRSQYDFALVAIYALVIIGAVIALLSIANTMFLSVYERTREIGLLRGVGMSRAQVRSMIRGEGLVISALGGTLGAITGAGGAVLLVRALRLQGLDVIVVPWAQLCLFVAFAAGSGVIAAVLPAIRAARLPVLDAISVEFHDSGDRN